jgi:hypothetical protein
MSLEAKIKKAVESAILDIAEQYQRDSPVGATGLLKSSWDVEVFGDNNSITGIISNTATSSKYRGLGRDKGGFPPLSPLVQWVKAKIEPDEKKAKAIAFLIGRKIANEGTDRYKKNENPFMLERTGQKTVQLKQLFLERLSFYLKR